MVSADLRGLATGPPTGVGGGLGQFPTAGASCSSDFGRQTRQIICSVYGYTTQGSVITYVIAPGFLSVSNPRFLDKSRQFMVHLFRLWMLSSTLRQRLLSSLGAFLAA